MLRVTQVETATRGPPSLYFAACTYVGQAMPPSEGAEEEGVANTLPVQLQGYAGHVRSHRPAPESELRHVFHVKRLRLRQVAGLIQCHSAEQGDTPELNLALPQVARSHLALALWLGHPGPDPGPSQLPCHCPKDTVAGLEETEQRVGRGC